MLIRIEVLSKITDARANVRRQRIAALGLLKKIKDVRLSDVYTIDKEFTPKQVLKIAQLLTNPVTQKHKIVYANEKNIGRKEHNAKISWAIEIGYLPGVTDNIANTAKEVIEDSLKVKFTADEGVYTSQVTYLNGNLTQSDITLIAESLYNPLIQRSYIRNFKALPSSKFNAAIMDVVTKTILEPTLQGMQQINSPYKGVLNARVVMTNEGPKVLHFSCCFDDSVMRDMLPHLETDLLGMIEGVLFETPPKKSLRWKQKMNGGVAI